MYISTVISNHNLYVYTYVNYINMTIYDNCKKELREWGNKNSDCEFMLSHIIHTFIFGIGLFVLITPLDLSSVTAGERLIIAFGSSYMVLSTITSTVYLFTAAMALVYIEVIDILKWIKHKWSEL